MGQGRCADQPGLGVGLHLSLMGTVSPERRCLLSRSHVPSPQPGSPSPRAAPVPGQSRGLSRAGDMRAIGCPIQKGQGSRVVLTQPRGLRQEQTPTLRQAEAVGVRALCECQGAGWGHCP